MSRGNLPIGIEIKRHFQSLQDTLLVLLQHVHFERFANKTRNIKRIHIIKAATPYLGQFHRLDLGVHAEAIEELGAELALLGVAGSDEDEAGGVADGDTLTLHSVPPRSGRIEEDIHEVVIEKVHLVDVQDAAVSLGEQTGLERPRVLSRESTFVIVVCVCHFIYLSIFSPSKDEQTGGKNKKIKR